MSDVNAPHSYTKPILLSRTKRNTNSPVKSSRFLYSRPRHLRKALDTQLSNSQICG